MLAALTMLFIDRNYGGVFFDAGEGGAPLLYEHLAWFFFTGAYMLVLIVAAGVISDVLPTFARKPLFSHRGAMLSLLAIAVLGPLAWMQNMYTAPIPLGFEIFAMLFALALDGPDRAADLQLDRDAVGRHAAPPGGAAVRARRDQLDDDRARRRARLLRDPGRLAARQHHRRPGRHVRGAGRRRGAGRLRRAPLLVPEAHRPH